MLREQMLLSFVAPSVASGGLLMTCIAQRLLPEGVPTSVALCLLLAEAPLMRSCLQSSWSEWGLLLCLLPRGCSREHAQALCHASNPLHGLTDHSPVQSV